MRKIIGVIGVSLLIGAIALLLASTARAQSPHFIGTAAMGGVFADGGISVGPFKEAGLGDNALTTYALTGHFTADYGCVNHGGNHPAAANKEAVAGNVDAIAMIASSKNGNVIGTLNFVPPAPATVLSCPGNQMAVLADISYTGLALVDQTNGVSATLDKTALSAVFFEF